MARYVLGLFLAAALAGSLWAENPDPRAEELRTAGYYELVARARELGLDTTGSIADLRARVAQSLGVVLTSEAAAGAMTLSIDSAQEAGLVTVDAPGDGKLLRLSGGLQVTLVDTDKKVTHIVVADELWYDQPHEEMTARGNVVYTMVRESSKEIFRGESLTFRLSDSQGVFFGGSSDRPRTVGTQSLTFRYSGDAIRRSAEDLVVLDTGSITSSLGADPYYQVKATKIWVLAPGEWGLQNAVLYLGRVPVFYFPFFFQPGDEFFFNPVLSFPDSGDRRGTSLQTTTYFWGKKTKDSAPLSFLQLEDSKTQDDDRVQRGLFLVRRPSSEKKTVSPIPANWILKYQADFYANLGFLTGVDLSTPGLGGLKTLTAFGGLGITRTVSSDGTPFSINPFQSALDPADQSDWNGSWFGNVQLPFRWGGRLATDAGWGAVSLEYYSDSLLYNDLTGNRSENFNLFSLVGLGSTKTTTTATSKSSLQWSGTLALTPLTGGASLLWDAKTVPTASLGPDNDPENTFYTPSQLILPQLTLALQGNLWPPAKTVAPKDGRDDLLAPEDQPEASSPGPGTQGELPPVAETVLNPEKMESLSLKSASATADGWTSSASWTLKPTGKTDTRFDTSVVLVPSDSSWEVLTSRISASYDGKLNLSTGLSDGTWTTSEVLSIHQQLQDTWYLGPSVTETQSSSYADLDEQATSSLLSQTITSIYKPFVAGGAWRDTNAQYTLGTKLWEDTATLGRFFDGTSDTVTSHSASTQAVVYLWETNPTLKVQSGWQTTLPPLDLVNTYSSAADATWGTVKASTKVTAKKTETEVIWDPWESSLEWTPLTGVSAKETFQFDVDNRRPSLSTTILSAFGFSAQYRHQRTVPYSYDTDTRSWVVDGATDFLPQELRFGYSLNIPGIQWWYYRNSLSSTVNFSWPINLQKYSDMPLSAEYSLVYKLARFLDFQIAGKVQNKTAYRYFPALAESFGEGAVEVVNPLVDLWDSLSIWDQDALRRTGFKMTTLSLGLVHYLDDWQVKLTYSGSPALNDAGTEYNWEGTLTLLVQWYPIPELKTQLDVDKDGQLTIAKNGS